MLTYLVEASPEKPLVFIGKMPERMLLSLRKSISDKLGQLVTPDRYEMPYSDTLIATLVIDGEFKNVRLEVITGDYLHIEHKK